MSEPRIIDLNSPYIGEINCTDIFPMYQRWNNHEKYRYLENERPNNGFFLTLCDQSIYKMANGKTIVCHMGDVVYLPKHARYEVEFLVSQEGVSQILINFLMYDTAGRDVIFSDEITKVTVKSDLALYDLFDQCVKDYTDHVKNECKIKSDLYRIIHELCVENRRNTISKTEFKIILKGILYIENNLSKTVSVAEIAKMCNVSETFFRKLFKKYAGTSPILYKNKIIMEKAKQLLEETGSSIDEIVNALGFYDRSYFYKMFRRYTGVTPKKYKELFCAGNKRV